MTKTIKFNSGLVPLLALVAATAVTCVGQPEQELPPPDLARREQRLAEVREQLDVLSKADVAGASALLAHADHRVRRAAALRLAEAGPEASAALNSLIPLLEDEHPRVRTAAARALGAIGDPAALDPLIAALLDQNRHVRLWAWKSVRKCGEEAVPRLVFHMGQQSPLVDRNYTDELGAKQSIRVEIRKRMSALGTAVVPQMIETMQGDDELARVYATRVLGDIGPDAKDALPVVIEAIDHEDQQMRRAAAKTLGDIGDLDPGVIPALRRASKDRTPKVARAAKQALKDIERAAKAKEKRKKRKHKAKKKRPRTRPKQTPTKAPAKVQAGSDPPTAKPSPGK